ncbi:hypothetical protein BgAZ_501120 [Babesia gibsoni]|uniref:CTLH domain-containing protein n=1 Tax=Babesia gibsoni TaxID=33632 RepID=A0AAD8P7N3_BABGI|nr:hypothetical protein BgAZ_501120 [Babesia gibsoni]
MTSPSRESESVEPRHGDAMALDSPRVSSLTSDSGQLYFSCFTKALSDVKVKETDLEHIVMNYLFNNMYEESYRNFVEECGYQGPDHRETLSHRIQAKKAVMEGRTDDVMNIINDIEPNILKNNLDIQFNLLSSGLVDHVKQGDMMGALKYGRNVLSPLVQRNTQLIESLEEIMSLFSFKDLNNPEAVEIMSKVKRPDQTALLLDKAILDHFELSKGTILECLVKEAKWFYYG